MRPIKHNLLNFDLHATMLALLYFAAHISLLVNVYLLAFWLSN